MTDKPAQHDPSFIQKELETFAHGCGVELPVPKDPTALTEDEQADEAFLDRIRGFIGKGWLQVDETGEATYTMRGKDVPFKTAKFVEPCGRDYRKMDQAPAGESNLRIELFLSSITGEPIQTFADVRKTDREVLIAIARFLLG